MMMRNKICFILVVSIVLNLSAQTNKYKYQRELKGISGQWNEIELPLAMIGKLNRNYSDLRIFALNKLDTIEVPYVLKWQNTTNKVNKVAFKILNESQKGKYFYFTFLLEKDVLINSIIPDFKIKNYDWPVVLEGSNNNKEWFKIVNNYRLLSIENNEISFKYNTINIPSSLYKYYRLRIPTTSNPQLLSADISIDSTLIGNYRTIRNKITSNVNDGKSKSSIIVCDLEDFTNVSSVSVYIKDTLDYYRQIKIESLIDSVFTEKGTIYNYEEIYSGVVSSVKNNIFQLNDNVTNKLRFTIYNFDNSPLAIDSISVNSSICKVIARFPVCEKAFLVYGNRTIDFPNYDLKYFEGNLPNIVPLLDLGKEELIPEKIHSNSNKSFTLNKIFLWITIVVIGIVIVFFSFKLLKNN